MVAELVLEPLEEHPVAGAVRQHARQEEAADSPPGAWASTRNRSHIGAEVNHLWPVQRVRAVGRSASPAVVPARTSEPPCFSVIDMPASETGFVVRDLQLGVIRRGWSAAARRPAASSALCAQRRHHGVGHRDGADVARLGALHTDVLGRAHDVRARPVVGPGRGVQPCADRDRISSW